MRPVLEQVSRQFQPQIDVLILDIRIEANELLAERYQMRTMPLTVLVDGSGTPLWRHEGYVDFETVSAAITKRLAAAEAIPYMDSSPAKTTAN